MLLAALEHIESIATDEVIQLGQDDHDELVALYRRAYPGSWFDPRMLETGQYYGVRHGRHILCVAGVHVYSPEYGVAALGS